MSLYQDAPKKLHYSWHRPLKVFQQQFQQHYEDLVGMGVAKSVEEAKQNNQYRNIYYMINGDAPGMNLFSQFWVLNWLNDKFDSQLDQMLPNFQYMPDGKFLLYQDHIGQIVYDEEYPSKSKFGN